MRRSVRSTVATIAAGCVDLLHGVGDGDGRDGGAGRAVAASMARVDQSIATKTAVRRRGSGRYRACVRASASIPARTEPCRVAPPCTGGSRSSPAVAARNIASSSGWMTGCTASMARCEAKRARLGRITGSPAIARYCFGTSPPAREPASGRDHDRCHPRRHESCLSIALPEQGFSASAMSTRKPNSAGLFHAARHRATLNLGILQCNTCADTRFCLNSMQKRFSPI